MNTRVHWSAHHKFPILVLALTMFFGLAMTSRTFAQVSYLTQGSTYSQNFDNLFGSVPANNTTTAMATILPAGWSVVEAGANADTNIRIDNGSSGTGDTFLFGATSSNERALGSYSSGSLNSQYGVQLVNNSGSTITSFTVTFDGEQWKDGGSATAVFNKLTFSYGLGASSITSGTYVNDTGLDFTALVNNTSADATKDGNNASFRTAGITKTITGISWLNGQSLWLRWTDINDTGNDDGLAIDNFSFTTPAPAAAVTTTALTASVNPSAYNQAVTFTATLRTNAVTAANATSNYVFKVDGTAVATNALANGAATYTTTGLSVGAHTLTAEFTGTASYLPSTNQLTQTVNKAASGLVLVSSLNPAGYLASVNFTASVPATATGNVVFSTNNFPFSTNTLASGTARSANLGNLPRGTNVITAGYVGDANYFGATNTFNQSVTNHPPVAANDNWARAAGITSLKIKITDLFTNDTDMDGDTLTLVGVSSATNGGTLNTNANYILYANVTNANDQFTYTVTDGFGATVSAVVNVTVTTNLNLGGQTQTIALSGSTATLNFTGIPGYGYAVQRSTNLVNWEDVFSTNAPSNGTFQFVDDLGSVPPSSAYYRLRYQP